MRLRIALSLMWILMLSASTLFAQPGDPGEGDPDAVPLTGLGYLLIAGGILGIKKLRDFSKNK